MDHVPDPLHRYLRSGLELEDTKGLVRPIVIVSDEIGDEAARVTESLRFGETIVRPPELHFGPVEVLDVDHHAVPMRNAPFCVTESFSDRLNPAILTIRAPELVDILVGRSRRHRLQPPFDSRLSVIRMDELEPQTAGQA